MSESGEAAASHTAVAKSGREITMTRTFDAPAHLVFEAYSTREHLMKWFGPEGYPVTMCEIDFRVGGKWRMAMTGPEGVQQTPFGGEYREIIPNKKIVFDNGFEEPGAPRMVMTVILDEDGSRTKLTFHTLFESEEMAKEYAELGFVDGTASGLDNLADLLARLVGGAILLEAKGTKFSTPSDTHLIAERTFDAPRELIWDCWTKPEHITRWMLGPGGWTMPVCEVDLRVGGTWRFVWRNTEGTDMEMTGVYKEIQPYERLVNTENWGADWPETLQILELHDDNGRTRTISTVVYPSKEARDRATETGMLEGWAQSYVTLDGHLADDKTG